MTQWWLGACFCCKSRFASGPKNKNPPLRSLRTDCVGMPHVSQAFLRAGGAPSCVASAQAFALGMRQTAKTTALSPLEVLLQRGEALAPQLRPKEEGLEPEVRRQVVQLLEKGTENPLEAETLARLDLDELCMLAASLEPGMSVLGRLNYQRWASLCMEPSAAGRVIGPFIWELLHACDRRLDGDGSELVVYTVEAAAVASLEAALGLGEDGGGGAWPAPASALALELWEEDAQIVLRLCDRSGQAVPRGGYRVFRDTFLQLPGVSGE
ncbi:unnamed protein product [Effrenium voratum]|nr:unnamed protein product [Effrenium voratum]